MYNKGQKLFGHSYPPLDSLYTSQTHSCLHNIGLLGKVFTQNMYRVMGVFFTQIWSIRSSIQGTGITSICLLRNIYKGKGLFFTGVWSIGSSTHGTDTASIYSIDWLVGCLTSTSTQKRKFVPTAGDGNCLRRLRMANEINRIIPYVTR